VQKLPLNPNQSVCRYHLVLGGIVEWMNAFCVGACRRDGKPPNFITKAAMGITAGAVGSFIGTPAEISLIRMTADGRYLQSVLSR